MRRVKKSGRAQTRARRRGRPNDPWQVRMHLSTARFDGHAVTLANLDADPPLLQRLLA